jgi:CubicO group peptidase (beta-lactamase class C family)
LNVITMQSVASAQVAAIGYDAQHQVLAVQFVRTPQTTYRYRNVPADVAAAFLAAESKGKYFEAHVRGLYDFEKVPTEAPSEEQQAA